MRDRSERRCRGRGRDGELGPGREQKEEGEGNRDGVCSPPSNKTPASGLRNNASRLERDVNT